MSEKPETQVKPQPAKTQGDKPERTKQPRKEGEAKNPDDKKWDNKGENKGERKQYDRPHRNQGARGGNYKKNEDNNEESKEESKKEGDNTENPENQDKKNYGKKKQYKEKIVVTLETVIPDLPKKNEKLTEPDTKFFDSEHERLRKEVDGIYSKMNDMIRTEKEKLGMSTKETGVETKNLKELLKAKQDELKTVQAELSKLFDSLNEYKAGMEEYYEKSDKYRKRMKIIMPKDKMVKELQRLKDIQSKGSITIFEEKKIIREIGDLEMSLPYAEPLEALDIQFGSIKEKKENPWCIN